MVVYLRKRKGSGRKEQTGRALRKRLREKWRHEQMVRLILGRGNALTSGTERR